MRTVDLTNIKKQADELSKLKTLAHPDKLRKFVYLELVKQSDSDSDKKKKMLELTN